MGKSWNEKVKAGAAKKTKKVLRESRKKGGVERLPPRERKSIPLSAWSGKRKEGQTPKLWTKVPVLGIDIGGEKRIKIPRREGQTLSKTG